MIRFFFILLGLFITVPAIAAPLSFTVNMSEAVNVGTGGGTPRIAVNVGGVTRYASYAGGTGTSALTFTYTPQAGDVDLDGVAVSSPVDLNGGTITDLNGNAISNLTFTPPNTANVKVDYPSLSMDFTGSDYILSGTHYGTLSSFLTAAGGSFTRGSIGTYFDSSGTLQTAGNNVARFDYDPVSHAAKGILIEEQRINSIRNGQGVGAGVGAPGTLPTNWSNAVVLANGLQTSVVGINSYGSLGTIDLRVFGTPTNTTPAFYLEAPTQIPATTGQIWTYSFYAQIVGGSTAGFNSINMRLVERTSGGVIVVTGDVPALIGLNAVSQQRYSMTRTLSGGATTAFLHPGLLFSTTIGVPVDITIRIGGAQVEQGAFATSYIPTTNAAVTRQADIVHVPTGAWYDQNVGSLQSNISWESVSGPVSWPMLWQFNDGTGSNRWNLYYYQAGNNLGVDAFTGGVSQGFFSQATSSSGSTRNSAAQSLNNANAAYNGVLKTLDTAWTPPPVTRLRLEGASGLRKWISSFKYYPARVADAQLQLLTQ